MERNLGTVNDLIEYFNLNKQLFEKERNNKEHMERIMAMLTQENMKILQKQFQLYTKGLELPTFIYLMKKLYVPQSELSKYYFVSDLIKFFQAIDVNGDGHLEWSEFTEYIIENIRRVERPNYKNKTFEENEIISSAYSKISNEYKITRIVDTGASNCIKKVIYLNKEQKYFVLETGSNSIKVFNSTFQPIDSFTMKHSCDSTYIIDFSFDQQNEVFCALFDGSARFCNIKIAGAIKFMNEVEEKKLKNYHKVEYLHLHKMWAFLSKTGDVKYSRVSYKSRTQMDYSPELTLKIHEGLVTDIVEVEEPKYILTSSMDGSIKLFSMILGKSLNFEHTTEETHSVINGKNMKGILGVDYTREFGSYILSYGFSTNISIYSLDVSLTKGYTGKYSEHSGNLISAKFLRCFPYVLSFDDKLNLRIWDFRTFQTIQIINCEKNFINPTHLSIIPELSECLICEKKITQFRAPSLEKKSKEINQFYSIFDFKICSMTNNIFVFTSNDVRVYNYITGALMNVFAKLNENSFDTNITAAEFGYKSRKFFLGDAGGFVREFDSETGEYLQEICPPDDIEPYENRSIVKIIFLKEHSLLVVCSEDGRIMVYERNSESEFIMVRDIREAHEELTAAGCSVRYCLLATGAEDGTVSVWNLEKFALQSVLVVEDRIVAIDFSPIHPIMLVTDSSGLINLFYVKPLQNLAMRYKCFAKIQSEALSGNGLSTMPISSFSFDLVINAYFDKNCSLIQNAEGKHHMIVTMGMPNGEICIANLNPILSKFNIQENHQIFNTKKSIRCEVQNARMLIANQKNKILSLHGHSNLNAELIKIQSFNRVKRFQGHKDPVDQLFFVKENSIVLSTSSDKKLKVWNLQGQMNGSIDFFTFKKQHWKVSLINFHKKIQAIQTCIYAIKLIQNRKFSPEQEEDIKINLLMNEFMNDKEKLEYFTWIKLVNRNRCNNMIRTRHVRKKVIEKDKRPSNTDSDGSENEELLEEYFRSMRHDMNDEILDSADTATSPNEFDQIYHNLVSKIKTHLSKDSAGCQFSTRNLNIKSEVDVDVEKPKSSAPHKIQSLLGLNFGLIADIKKDRITSDKEEKQYERLFRKTINAKTSPKSKQKKANLLYQNLTEARRKIDLMSKVVQDKKTGFNATIYKKSKRII